MCTIQTSLAVTASPPRRLHASSLKGGGFVSQGVFGEGDIVSSSVLPGLRVLVSDVFEY